jgi:hypothetical protein
LFFVFIFNSFVYDKPYGFALAQQCISYWSVESTSEYYSK